VRDALAICEKSLGSEHPDTLDSLNNLAEVLRDQGDFAGARALCERALAISEKALDLERTLKALETFAPRATRTASPSPTAA
jgi:tetratricopeptide (TPR) repeat protein